jgi:hydroxymethylcytosylglucuronate/cytosylglucuronate synthase
MSDGSKVSLLVAALDLGWGSLGKLRLILDQLPDTEITLHGSARIVGLTKELLGSRYEFKHSSQRPDVALVINDPAAANDIGHRDVPVIYVDSVPYMRRTESELPEFENLAFYCAQKYPVELMSLPDRLRNWPHIKWIDPIVPVRRARRGGQGIVISVGGLTNPLASDAVDAYVNLVLFPLVRLLRLSGRTMRAICGSLNDDVCRQLRVLVPECDAIGPQSSYAFERLLIDADLLITAPGSTTMLQALSLGLPTLLLPPQNRSQIFNARLYAKPNVETMRWPARILDETRVEQLLPQGRDLARQYVYQAIMSAANSREIADEVATIIQTSVNNAPADGVLDQNLLRRFGFAGASQIAQVIKGTATLSGGTATRY